MPLEELLYDPIYQIVRLGLLGDKMVMEGEFGISEFRVIIVCPEENTNYRNRVTSTPLHHRFPLADTIEKVAKGLWKDPRQFVVTSQEVFINAIRKADFGHELDKWSDYQRERYGW